LIEQAIYFALGFFIATLSIILLLPALWRRAKRLSMRQLEMQLPRSMGEIAAERSLLRAQCAFRERRLEQEARAVRTANAQIMAHAGRQAASIIDLDARLANSQGRAELLETQLSETKKVAEETSCALIATRSELDALKAAKSTLDSAFAQISARLRMFETRHSREADVERVMRARSGRPPEDGEISPFANDNAANNEETDVSASQASAPIAPYSPDWANWVEEAALDALPPGEAIARLQRRAGREDEVGARALAETLGRRPLTLDLAAAYCKRTQTSFTAYAAKASTLMSVAPQGKAFPRSVAAAFDLAAAQAIKQAPAAETLIAFLALCAPEPIPTTFVAGVSENRAESLAALMALTEMSLIRDDRYEDGTPAVSAHRLVRALARARADAYSGVATAIGRMIVRLTEIYPVGGYDNQATWPLCAKLTPHLLALCNTKAADETWSVERADLMVRAGCYFQGREAYAQAEPLFQIALAIREREFGAMHPETAASLNNLATLAFSRGDVAGAEPLLRRALAIFQQAFGSDYSHTGRHEANYARLLLMVNRPKQALAHAEAALTTIEKSSGPNHPWTMDAARVAADALAALGRIKKAEALRARYEIATEASPRARSGIIRALHRPSLTRQFGLSLAKSWRFLWGGSVAKSH
jgi:tetratricopeptide (TPR) repeat protein